MRAPWWSSGPGTGGTTHALLRALPADAKLLAIEIDPRFSAMLRAEITDPRFIVHAGSAADIARSLSALRACQRRKSSFPASRSRRCPRASARTSCARCGAALAPGGRFVAYQFRDRIAVLGRHILGQPDVDVELLNVPPMRVYCWRKPR